MPAIATKRKRSLASAEQPSLNTTDLPEKHEKFKQWCIDRGAEINGVSASQIPGRGLGLVTTKAIKKDERILFVPEKIIFKPKSKLLKERNFHHASPQAQLAFSAILAKTSLETWRETWPTPDDLKHSMPSWWDPPYHDLLPQSVNQPLDRLRADYAKDWKDIQEWVNDRDSRLKTGVQSFEYYWTIVNNRSFYWKPPTGKAGSMVMCPYIDYMNHGPSGETCRVMQSAKGYEVFADRHYRAGEEVLANYGAHTNDKLLVHYGFVLSHEPSGHSIDDDVRLDHLILPKLSSAVRDRLRDVGFLGGYGLLPASNELCFKTQVAVRAQLLTCNEWEHFLANGEDLTTDHSEEVNCWVRLLLVDYRDTAEQKMLTIGDVRDEAVRSILTLRWSQIIDAIDRFLSSLNP